jgi:UDP-2,4-diacetamido-2,4,6-trideoxy-beta-L-altropyranose hydrolase
MLWIRADGNACIGAGHLMRCLTIADEVRRKNNGADDIAFVCADEESAGFVSDRGYNVLTLGTDYKNMEEELPIIADVMSGYRKIQKTDVILIDSYYVTEKYLNEIRKLVFSALMDDFGDRLFAADCVINYNAFADKESYRQLYSGTDTRLCIGSEYIPIRSQFTDCQFTDRGYRVRDEVKNVLITTGGGDAENIAGKILSELYNKNEKLNYDLIIGKFNPNLKALQQMAESNPRIKIHTDVLDMASLMMQSDIAITAGGTTVYELAALGIPMICFSYAENQEKLTDYIENSKIAGCGGKYHREPEQVLTKIKELFSLYCRDYSVRNTCYLKERKLVDGKGGERLAGVLCEIMQNGI